MIILCKNLVEHYVLFVLPASTKLNSSWAIARAAAHSLIHLFEIMWTKRFLITIFFPRSLSSLFDSSIGVATLGLGGLSPPPNFKLLILYNTILYCTVLLLYYCTIQFCIVQQYNKYLYNSVQVCTKAVYSILLQKKNEETLKIW